MEFLRFGSSIPGSYWGCCACCIIQNFKVEPDALASIQVVNGDQGVPVMDGKKGAKYLGKTWREIFWSRLRIGTFSDRDMPNHAFIAILTEWQIQSSIGKKWLEILREAGFEFIRTVNNSVYSGATLADAPAAIVNNNDNHIFGLFRNIGASSLKDPFTPPKAWTDLPAVKTEALITLSQDDYDFTAMAMLQFGQDKAIWEKMGPAKTYSEAELTEAGVPVWVAGLRSPNPQELKRTRDSRNEAEVTKVAKASPNVMTALTPQIVPLKPMTVITAEDFDESEEGLCDDPECGICY